MTGSRKGTQGAGTIRNEPGFGPTPLVDATPARNHIQTAINYGMTLNSIAAAAACDAKTIANIHNHKRAATKQYIANAILDIKIGIAEHPYGPHNDVLVPSRGAIRRLQALRAIGWDQAELAKRCGTTVERVTRYERVRKSTHDRIATVYNQLHMTPGPSTRAQAWARRLGYPTPAAWDDIDNDPHPPTSSFNGIDEAAIVRVLNGDRSIKLTTPERHHIITMLNQRGYTDTRIANTTGIPPGTVGITRIRLGLPLNPANIDYGQYGEKPRARTRGKKAA